MAVRELCVLYPGNMENSFINRVSKSLALLILGGFLPAGLLERGESGCPGTENAKLLSIDELVFTARKSSPGMQPALFVRRWLISLHFEPCGRRSWSIGLQCVSQRLYGLIYGTWRSALSLKSRHPQRR